jgi:hypothetical protein
MCLISAEILLKRMRSDTSTGPLAEPLPRRRTVPVPVRVTVPLHPESDGIAGSTGPAGSSRPAGFGAPGES